MDVTNFYNYGVMNEVEAGATQNNYYYGMPAQPADEEDDGEEAVDMAMVAKAVGKCQAFMWGNAALAVVFCVCRDCIDMGSNMSLFERQLQEQGVNCPTGTLAAAMQNNPYMKLPIERWKDNGAKERALILIKEFRKSMEETMTDTPET
jgi:hypothetical protein